MHVSKDLKEKAALFKKYAQPSMIDILDIVFESMEAGKVVGSMPVSKKTHQPFGVLHGGASVALAETLASVGGWLLVDVEQETTVGIEINANHIRPVKSGKVTGIATCAHQGRKTQVWDIRIQNEKGQPVCISRCTLAVVPRPKDV